MPAYSATTVQKAYKEECTTVFGEATIATGTPTLVVAKGASKGIASIEKLGTGEYKITLESSFPVQIWLGAPVITLLSSTDKISNIRVTARTVGSGASITFKNFDADATPAPGTLADLADGTLLVTLTYTTSNVF